MEGGRINLELYNYKVDYVISHCASNRMQEIIQLTKFAAYGHRSSYKTDILTGYFEEIEQKLSYEHWFCGHYHFNELINSRHLNFKILQ